MGVDTVSDILETKARTAIPGPPTVAAAGLDGYFELVVQSPGADFELDGLGAPRHGIFYRILNQGLSDETWNQRCLEIFGDIDPNGKTIRETLFFDFEVEPLQLQLLFERDE